MRISRPDTEIDFSVFFSSLRHGQLKNEKYSLLNSIILQNQFSNSFFFVNSLSEQHKKFQQIHQKFCRVQLVLLVLHSSHLCMVTSNVVVPSRTQPQQQHALRLQIAQGANVYFAAQPGQKIFTVETLKMSFGA